MEKNSGVKLIAQNKKAYHDYFVLEKLEAGIELFGTEVKSIREGRINLKDSWCFVKDGEMLANGVHISPYERILQKRQSEARDRSVQGQEAL